MKLTIHIVVLCWEISLFWSLLTLFHLNLNLLPFQPKGTGRGIWWTRRISTPTTRAKMAVWAERKPGRGCCQTIAGQLWTRRNISSARQISTRMASWQNKKSWTTTTCASAVQRQTMAATYRRWGMIPVNSSRYGLDALLWYGRWSGLCLCNHQNSYHHYSPS